MSRWAVAVPARAELGRAARLGPGRGLPDLGRHQGREAAPGTRPGGADEVIRLDAGVRLGAAAPRRGGGYVLAAADGFRFADAAGRLAGGPLRPPGMGADLRFNDGACDPAGRFWAGTVAARPAAGRGAAVPAGRRPARHRDAATG